jgi:hypothetical protein
VSKNESRRKGKGSRMRMKIITGRIKRKGDKIKLNFVVLYIPV